MRKSYRKTYGYVEKYYPMKKRYPYTLAVRNFLKVENCGEITFP